MRGVRMRAALYGVIFSMGFFLSKGFISTGGCFFGTMDVFRHHGWMFSGPIWWASKHPLVLGFQRPAKHPLVLGFAAQAW